MIYISDYVPSFVNENLARSYFDPPLSSDDISKAKLLLIIESVETYIKSVYELTAKSDAKIPALFLVVSKIVHDPVIAKKHYTLKSESIRNYNYTLDTSASPYSISKSLEQMAEEMLKARSYVKDNKLKVYISNG